MKTGLLARMTLAFGVLFGPVVRAAEPSAAESRAVDAVRDRSPIALALSPDGTRLLTANQTSGTVSLVDLTAGRALDEVSTGEKPSGVAISSDGRLGVVTHWYGYDLAVLNLSGDRLKVTGRIAVGPEPRGVALTADGRLAYVAVGASNEVVRVDLVAGKVDGRLGVGREPRAIALSTDGATLLVGNARSRSLSVISTQAWKVERTLAIDGDNLRQVALSADGRTGYVANMRNRGFATTSNNIDIGWVLGQRLTKVTVDGSQNFGTLSLDPRGKAAADAHGVAVSRDGRYLAVSCGGTHEVMIFRTDLRRLPWREGNSRDLIAVELLSGDGRFRRVDLGGRPTELAFAADNKTLLVANYLLSAVQVVDAEGASVVRTVPLGPAPEPSLARQGEILFHAAERSFNQWYSCNTCHSDGHTNGLDFDTMNDGRHDYSMQHQRSRKKVPTLRRVTQTGPWTWHGWQKSLEDSVVESFTKSMQGTRPSSEEVRAVVAYLGTLDYPRNPYREGDGERGASIQRGAEIFRSARAACEKCHGGPELTDGKVHIAGLEEPDDVYKGYNPPSLRGVYDKDPYLHDGRSATLTEMLDGPHSPDMVSGRSSLNESELRDLVAYLKTL